MIAEIVLLAYLPEAKEDTHQTYWLLTFYCFAAEKSPTYTIGT